MFRWMIQKTPEAGAESEEVETVTEETEIEAADSEADEIETAVPQDDEVMDEAEIPETGAELEKPETEIEETDTAEADTVADAEETPQYTEQQLMRMVKSELMVICDELGLEYDDTATKAELTMLILGENDG